MGDALEYYIRKLPSKASCLDLSTFSSISTGAFKYAPVENILFSKIIKIEESTFENCKELKFVGWIKLDGIEDKTLWYIKSNSKKIIKTFDFQNQDDTGDVLKVEKIGRQELIISKNAFKGCDNLETVILPKNKCIIGKDAFACCKSLRTVIYLGNDISFIDNPFIGCEDLTIIYMKNNRYIKSFLDVHPYNPIEIG